MRICRLVLLVCAALLLPSLALAQDSAQPKAPTNLRPFLLRAGEPATHVFPRTPSFSWAPVRGALRYEFQLAKSPGFEESSVLYATSLKSPAVSIPMALPWMTGSPYAAYARVRARSAHSATPWSASFGFNVQWESLPTQLPSQPGLARWAPVLGATSYHVWFTDVNKVVATRTNAVDEREFYTFHPQPQFTGAVHWRVRAVRTMFGSIPSGLPRVTYGPWSKSFTSTNPALAGGPLKLVSSLSETATESTATQARAHRLTPSFQFSGNQVGNTTYGLFRVYVFSDNQCVNVIYRGAVVGSPAYVPRTTGPLALPVTSTGLLEAATTYLPDGREGKAFMADTSSIQTTESDKPLAAVAAGKSGAGSSSSKSSGPAAGQPDDTSLPSLPALTGAPVDLWDSGWPNGRFYWTVIPVVAKLAATKSTILLSGGGIGSRTITVASLAGISTGSTLNIGSGQSLEVALVESISGSTVNLTSALNANHGGGETVTQGSQVEYRDAELPQDACGAGRILAFGKQSEPVVAGGASAYASGLSPKGRLVSSVSPKSSFFGSPLIAWQPALGADTYQVEWSRSSYPWKAVGSKTTQSTSVLLPLKAGVWFYRVRGINALLPGSAKAMSWSTPQELSLAKPKFRLVASSK